MTGIDRRQFLAASAAAALPFSTRTAQASAWEARTPLPWPVQEIYAAVWNGRIVTAGGLVGRPGRQPLHVEDRVGLYDPVSDAWSEAPVLPARRHHPMMIGDDALGLFAVGGYGVSEAGEWTGMREVWRLEGDAWVRAASLPEPQGEAVGLAHGGRLHLIGGRSPAGAANGGWNDQADVATHRVLDPSVGGWHEARPCPTARNSAAGAVLNGALWVAGGRTVRGGGTGQLDRYDPGEDRWDTLAPIPRSAAAGQQVGGGLAMVAIGGRLVAFGGEWFAPGGGGVFRETWIYDPATDAWSAGPDMKTPRHGLAAAAVGGTVYAIAGGAVVSGGQAVGTVEALRI
jgi:N-acetylneuraminic acid mutarotase